MIQDRGPDGVVVVFHPLVVSRVHVPDDGVVGIDQEHDAARGRRVAGEQAV